MIYQPKPPLGRVLNRKHPLAKGLVGAWVFNEQSGDTVFDLSEHGNDGTVNGADWVQNGLDFVAINSDEITFGDIVDGFAKLSVVTSCKNKDANISTEMHIVSERPQMELGKLSSEVFKFRLVNTGLTANTIYSSAYADTDIHSVCGVYDGSYLKIYVDGVSAATPVAHTGDVQTHDYDFRIGSKYGGVNYWDGKIYYVYIYNRALLPSEVAEINRDPYQMFRSPIDPALFYYETPVGGNWFLLPAENQLQGMRGING